MAIELDDLAGKEGGTESRRLAGYWLDQVAQVLEDKDFKRWQKRGTTIEKRFRDERNRTDEEGQRRYNSLWANVEILKPALYGKTPTAVAERRFRDKDPTGRAAAQMLERALRNEIEICGFDDAMQRAVLDYLLCGRGVVWVRYEPEMEEGMSVPPDAEMDIRDEQGEIVPEEDPAEHETPKTKGAGAEEQPDDSREEDEAKGEKTETEEHEHSEGKLRETLSRIARESCPIDYIQWSDFFSFPARARIWREVVAVGKRCYMTRDQLIRRFGKEIGKAIPLQKDDREQRRQPDSSGGHEVEQKAQIYEIWSKTDEGVYWVAEGYTHLLDRKDDPLTLENFFPVPPPLYANATNNTLIPVPDFIQYQDQAIQIDELTQRISMLAKACKVAGVYNAAARSIRRLLDESVENELIPVDDWTAFAEKGGVAGNISLLPLKEIMGVINELMMIKKECVEEMDRLTGVNDIMRGTSDARETLGGVRLKSNNTGTRLQRRQNEVARFARDTLRIVADIMCQHFSPQSLIEVSGALYEEGLGPDMPSLSAIQGAQPPPALPPPGAPPPPGAAAIGPPGVSPPPAAPGGPPPSPMGAPGQPPGGPMGAPPPPGGPQPPGAPPGLPAPMGQPPMGMQPQQPPQPPPEMLALQRIAAGIKLLRNEKLRGFRVDIETDSTIYGDQDQDKQERTAFITAVTQYLATSIEMSAQVPEIAPLLGKLLQFSVRGHRIGRDLEQTIEDFTEQAVGIAKQHQAAAGAGTNPEVVKAHAMAEKSKADIAQTQMKGQIEQQKGQAEVKRQETEAQSEAYNSQMEIKQKQFDMEMQKVQMEIEKMKLQIEMAKLQATHQQTQADIQLGQQQFSLDQQNHQADAQAQVRQQGHEMQMQDKEAQSQDRMLAHKEAQQAMPPKVEQQGAGGL